MPQDRLLWVDFEELSASPRNVMQHVLRFLHPGLPSENLEHAPALVPVHDGGRASALSDPLAQTLEKSMAAGRHRFGRGSPDQST